MKRKGTVGSLGECNQTGRRPSPHEGCRAFSIFVPPSMEPCRGEHTARARIPEGSSPQTPTFGPALPSEAHLPPALAISTSKGVIRDSRVRTAGRTPAQPTSCDGMRRPPSPDRRDGNVCPRGTTERSDRAVLQNPATRGCPKQNPGSARLSVNATQTTSSQTTHDQCNRLPRHIADADKRSLPKQGLGPRG